MLGVRLVGVVSGWSAATGYGWVACDGHSYFLHASQVDREQALAFRSVVEFRPVATRKGLAATNVVVLHDGQAPAVGPRVQARVLQISARGDYAVVVTVGRARRALVMLRDVSGDGEIEEGSILSGELVEERRGVRLLNVAVLRPPE